jgi:hypothetical protein
MTSSRGEDPTRWVRRKASDRGISSPPHDGCWQSIGENHSGQQTVPGSLLS